MLIKRRISQIALVTLCGIVNLNAFAASAPKGPDQILKPCTDDQTFAVIHVNIARLNLAAFVQKAEEIVNQQTGGDVAKNMLSGLKNFQEQASVQVNSLTDLGVRDIYAVFSMYDFPYFFVAVPADSAQGQADLNRHVELYQQIEKIAESALPKAGIELYASDGLILAGLPKTIARLKTVSPARSEALAKSLQACGDTTVQAAIFPTSDQRRILTEMLPQLATGAGTIDFTTAGKDLQWASLGFDGPPAISLNATIQAQNSQGADNLLTFVKDVYSLAQQSSKAKELGPQVKELLQRLTPEKQGNQLVLKVEPKAANSIIDDVVAPPLLKARQLATRMACANNLKGIGLAMLIYANDYGDKFPPNLEILTSTAEVSPKSLICPSTMQKDSYLYRGAGLATKDSPSTIMVYDRKGNHEDGRNVLFMDTHVEWVPEDRFFELIKKDNEYRRQKGYPEIQAQ